MKVSEEVRQNHRWLSRTALKFLNFVAHNPELTSAIDPSEIPDFLPAYFPMQPWPLFLSRHRFAELEKATVGITKLIKTVPERIFQMDAKKISSYYGIGNEFLTSLILAPPNGSEEVICRSDFILGERGFMCLECNASRSGGVEFFQVGKFLCGRRALRRFFNENAITPTIHNIFHLMLTHVIDSVLKKSPPKDNMINIAIVVERLEQTKSATNALIQEIYVKTLKERNENYYGRIILCNYGDNFTNKGTTLMFGHDHVSAVVEFNEEQTPEAVFRAFKAHTTQVFNGPIGYILSDKRNLAQLSQHQESDIYTTEEKKLIRKHVPWTRDLIEGPTKKSGMAFHLPEDLLERPDHWVVKKGRGYSGDGIYIGKFIEPRLWPELVRKAVKEGDWIVQEYIHPLPLLFQCGAQGYQPHTVVWGTFGFGEDFGGGFTRQIPIGSGGGIVNASRGASEGIFVVVDDCSLNGTIG